MANDTKSFRSAAGSNTAPTKSFQTRTIFCVCWTGMLGLSQMLKRCIQYHSRKRSRKVLPTAPFLPRRGSFEFPAQKTEKLNQYRDQLALSLREKVTHPRQFSVCDTLHCLPAQQVPLTNDQHGWLPVGTLLVVLIFLAGIDRLL